SGLINILKTTRNENILFITIWAIGEIGREAESAVPVLKNMLNNSNISDELKEEITEAIVKITEPES
ncbi:MAG: HEAT repeat domain-containing protein, partial [Armatimonadota bacterium]